MEYRQDIQIMRGIAVLLVVLFHMDLRLLGGGFLGVDVFFVISGFLMALLYKRGNAIEFYLRRARRLLPAYFFVVIATVLASTWLTLPYEHDQVVRQGVFASFFASNIGYWMQNSYFSKVEFNPLLHLWSLGLEIQFYLLFPFLVWLHFRNKVALFAIFLGSLLGCLALIGISPKTAFFMMPLRVWQFLLGSLVAYYLTEGGAIVAPRPTVGLTALLLLISTVMFFPVNGTLANPIWGHPGVAAMVVTVAMALILCFGFPKWLELGLLGRILKRLGDWSYSIYLVHFPIIVLMLYQPFSGTLMSPTSISQAISIVLLILVFTALSYSIFERGGYWAGQGFLRVVYAIAAVTMVALVSAHLNRWNYTEQQKNVFAAFFDRGPARCGKLMRIFSPQAVVCELTSGLSEDAPALLLIGDSHSDSIKTTFVDVARQHGYRVFFTVSNSPLIGKPGRDKVLAISQKLDVYGIVLHYATHNVDRAYSSGFIDQARDLGMQVVWLLPVPIYGDSVPKMIWNKFSENTNFHPFPQNAQAVQAFKETIMLAGIKTFDTFPTFCSDQCDVMDDSMRPFYFDDSHLTLTGAERLSPVITDLVKWLSDQSEREYGIAD